MALFARRTLQRILDENALFLTPKQALDSCNLLNLPRENHLATEWEQVILNSASTVGVVRHEVLLGSSRPDLIFQSNDVPLEFIADVTVASDQGFHDLNPVDAFNEEFQRLVIESNWLEGGFDVHIDPVTTAIYRGMGDKIRLKLPKRAKWSEEIFNARFYDFLRTVRVHPERPHRFEAVSPITGVRISYDPARRGTWGSGHLVYTLATTLDRNPVYRALKTKGDQIKAARYEGMAGIFLCDGGCQMLSSAPGISSYSCDEVIRYFLRQFDSVWFVAVFTVAENGSRLSVQAKLHLNSKKRAVDFSHLKQIVDTIYKSLPEPQLSPHNARNRIKFGDLGGRYCGTLTHGGNVKMSAREMLEILAGLKTVPEFEQNYSFEPGSNPFRKMLEAGRLISKVTVERFPEKDDDVVTIEFTGPDAAVAPFRAPRLS